MIAKTDDDAMKNALEEKNERRRDSLKSMRSEIKDEADYRNNK